MYKPSYQQCCEMIKGLPCFNHDAIIKEINAGQSSKCFKVLVVNEKGQETAYFVKYNNAATFFDEVNASKEAALSAISPNVIYHDEHWLVNEFIEGTTLDNACIPTEEKINITLNLMEKLEHLSISLPVVNLQNIITDIINHSCFSLVQRDYIQNVQSTLPCLNTATGVVCHGDINFSNVIVTKDHSWLIDFECACVADKEYELAMFFAVNLLNKTEQEYSINKYNAKHANQTINVFKLSHCLLYTYLINGLWYIEKYKDINNTAADKKRFYCLALQQLIGFKRIYKDDFSLRIIMR